MHCMFGCVRLALLALSCIWHWTYAGLVQRWISSTVDITDQAPGAPRHQVFVIGIFPGRNVLALFFLIRGAMSIEHDTGLRRATPVADSAFGYRANRDNRRWASQAQQTNPFNIAHPGKLENKMTAAALPKAGFACTCTCWHT